MQFNLPLVNFSVNDAGKVLFVIRQEESISPFYGLRAALLIIHEQEQAVRQGEASLDAIKKRLVTLSKRPKWFLKLVKKDQESLHLEDAVHGLEISLRDSRMQLKIAQEEVKRLQDTYLELQGDYETLQSKATTDALAHKLARALAISFWSIEHGLPETAGMAFFDAIEGLPPEKHRVFYDALNQKIHNAKLAGLAERNQAIVSASNSFTNMLIELPPDEAAKVLADIKQVITPAVEVQHLPSIDFSNIHFNSSGNTHGNF